MRLSVLLQFEILLTALLGSINLFSWNGAPQFEISTSCNMLALCYSLSCWHI